MFTKYKQHNQSGTELFILLQDKRKIAGILLHNSWYISYTIKTWDRQTFYTVGSNKIPWVFPEISRVNKFSWVIYFFVENGRHPICILTTCMSECALFIFLEIFSFFVTFIQYTVFFWCWQKLHVTKIKKKKLFS